MLQNKIYQKYYLEIIKTFFIIVLGLSLIALTVRAVNFLELIVDNGYPLLTYFKYSFLNLFGIVAKFIPLAFFISLIIFIIKHNDDSEFTILWTSGVKKIQLVNLVLLTSLTILIFYLFLSIILTPYALNKSRTLLTKDQFNSFLPTIRSQHFSDSFKGFTFIVNKKINNEIENIFLHDTGKNLSRFSSNISNVSSTTIIAEKGIVNNRNLFLVNGQIISTKIDNVEVVNFEELDINLGSLSSATIKVPKLQETSTLSLISCFFKNLRDSKICKKDTLEEIIPNLIRRIILPFYIPVVALLCSFLLIKNNIFFTDKLIVFTVSFLTLIFTELFIRYTGVNYFLRIFYIITPFALILFLYLSLVANFKKKVKIYG